MAKKKSKDAKKSKPKRPKTTGSFVDGNQVNAGREHLVTEERVVQILDRALIFRYLNQSFNLTLNQVQARLNDDTITVFERAILLQVRHVATVADSSTLDFLLDRLIGKVTTPFAFNKAEEFGNMSTEDLHKIKKDLDAEVLVHLRYAEQQPRHALLTAKAERVVVESTETKPQTDDSSTT